MYLAFVACAAKAPIRETMLDETLKRIAKAGDIMNIERWCFWTPTQLSLMELADKLLRVIIIGGNGVGKTVILDAFATKTAKKQTGNVIFAIHQLYPSYRPLLQLKLELKYEKLHNIKLKNFTNLDEIADIEDASLADSTICIDETDLNVVNSADLYRINAKALWVVIRNIEA